MSDEKNYICIDVSKNTLQIAVRNAGGNWHDITISNTVADINEWLQSVEPTAFFVFEYTGTYSSRLTYCLNLGGYSFCCLTATQSSGFGKTLKSTSKTDKKDARMLYLYGIKMQPEAMELPDEASRHKKHKFKHLTLLKTEKMSFANRLHAIEFDCFADPSVKKSIESTVAFFDTQIIELEKELFDDENNLPDYVRIEKLLTSIAGIGVKSATAINLATNGMANFDNPKAVAKYLGVCPSDKSSGSSLRGRGAIPKSGNAFVRKCLYMAALSAKKFNRSCKELYERLRLKSKTHKVAMIAVVHKLIRQAFAVIKNNVPFDNNFASAK